MEEDTNAIMLEFIKILTSKDGITGKVPIQVVIPSIPNDEKSKNQAYRVFLWYLKTKFEAIETGLVEFEQEFMPHIAIGNHSGFRSIYQAFKHTILPKIMRGEDTNIHLLEPPTPPPTQVE